MSNRTETRTIPATTREVVVGTYCDRCGQDIPSGGYYDTREARVTVTTGSSYPEGGREDGWCVPDLCDSCAEWLREVLVAGGVTLHEVDEGW